MPMTLNDLPHDGLAADIAVVGAGVAGQTIAKALANRGREVLLIESGGDDYDPQVQRLAAGENAGIDYYPLDETRLRFFGGTAAIWGGRSCRLDAIDFEARDWVPNSGWPFAADALAPYYDRAEAMLGIAAVTGAGLHSQTPHLDPAQVDCRLWRFDTDADRFTFARRSDVTGHKRIRILCHATATQIALGADGRAVESLTLAALDGTTRLVRPRQLVLACGGIENARLLLLSDDVAAGGIGNGHDWVGRCFMEHMHGRGGTIRTHRPEALLRLSQFFCDQDVLTMASLRPSEAVQRARGGLNTSFTIAARKTKGGRRDLIDRGFRIARDNFATPGKAWRDRFTALRAWSRETQLRVDPWRPGALVRMGLREVSLLLRAEQVPNPASRVTLSAARDALGLRATRLDWRLSPLDRHGARVAVEAFAEALGRAGLGELKPAAWLGEEGANWEFDPLVGKHWIGGYHHMGTTRMANEPKDGVCDADGRVHGIANLTIAGSSLFPTCGWANPTLTIMALALRQAEKLDAPS